MIKNLKMIQQAYMVKACHKLRILCDNKCIKKRSEKHMENAQNKNIARFFFSFEEGMYCTENFCPKY